LKYYSVFYIEDGKLVNASRLENGFDVHYNCRDYALSAILNNKDGKLLFTILEVYL
jgi:hypothetical protein